MAEPLVPPGPALTRAERTRFARHLLLPGVGELGQRRLRAARVLVVGAGGLGSPAGLYLAAAGIGTLTFVDDDDVDVTNLQRQVLHGVADVGRAKVDSAAESVARIAPEARVHAVSERLTADNALDLVADHDVVLDGADNFPTRCLVGDACARLGVPHVWGSVHRFDAQVSVWWAGVGPCYRCVFPRMPAPGLVPSCAVGGVLGSTVGAVGSVMATEVIKLVVGLGEPLIGRLLVHDGLRQTWDEVPVRAHPLCPVCGPGADPTSPLGGYAEPAAEPSAEAAAERPSVSVVELAGVLASGGATLVDVREPGEREVVVIPGAVPFPLQRIREGEDPPTPRGARVLVHCKSGSRSAEAVDLLRARGVDAVDVRGGVLAWVAEVDPTLATY